MCPSVRPSVRLSLSLQMSQSSKCDDEPRRPHNAKSPSLIDRGATRTHAGMPTLAVSHGHTPANAPTLRQLKRAPPLSAWPPLSEAQDPPGALRSHTLRRHTLVRLPFRSAPLYVFCTHTCTDAAALRAGGGGEQLSEEGVEKGRTWRGKKSMDYRMGFFRGVGAYSVTVDVPELKPESPERRGCDTKKGMHQVAV